MSHTASENLALEITVHRLGGPPGERQWGPWVCAVRKGGVDLHGVPGRSTGHDQMRVELSDWVTIDPEWSAGRMALSDVNGQPLGIRPFMLYEPPSDIATYTAFKHDTGLYSVGLRRIAYYSNYVKPEAGA